ncbi:hypothetical protein IWX50DRAFT_614382 [Phyllosticta citricarpa]|uniref:Uncharacterized protein n=1 Tax=Phyllosticta citricarpa TaxID=55181 RepID=A0ABR1MIF5_9PEZI
MARPSFCPILLTIESACAFYVVIIWVSQSSLNVSRDLSPPAPHVLACAPRSLRLLKASAQLLQTSQQRPTDVLEMYDEETDKLPGASGHQEQNPSTCVFWAAGT